MRRLRINIQAIAGTKQTLVAIRIPLPNPSLQITVPLSPCSPCLRASVRDLSVPSYQNLPRPVRTIERMTRILPCILLLIAQLSANAAEPPITAIVFSPNGNSVLATSQLGVRVYSWPELKRGWTIKSEAANLHCLSFSPNGKRLAIGGGHPTEEGIVQVYSWPTGKLLATLNEHQDSVRALAWQGDEKLLSASVDRQIKLWQLGKIKSVATYTGHSRSVASLCLLQRGKTLVSAGDDQSLRVWEAGSGKVVRRLIQHTRPIHDLQVRPGQSALPMVASAAADGTIRLWQPTIGRMVRFVRLKSPPLTIAWHKDAARIIAACTDGKVRVVDADEVKVTHTLPAIKGWAYAVAVHPSGKNLVVAGSGGQLKRLAIPAVASP